MTLKFESIESNEVIYNLYWKDVLLELLNGIGYLMIPSWNHEDVNTDALVYQLKLNHFSKKLGLWKRLEKAYKKRGEYKSLDAEHKNNMLASHTGFAISFVCKRLVDFGFMETSRPSSIQGVRGLNVDGYLFILTTIGLDISIKLQEHKDNKMRHEQTASFSKKALFVSSGALIVAGLSAWFNYQRLDLYEYDIKKLHEKTLDQQIYKPKGEKVIELPESKIKK